MKDVIKLDHPCSDIDIQAYPVDKKTLNRRRPTTSKQRRKIGRKCNLNDQWPNVEIATSFPRELSKVESTWKHRRCFELMLNFGRRSNGVDVSSFPRWLDIGNLSSKRFRNLIVNQFAFQRNHFFDVVSTSIQNWTAVVQQSRNNVENVVDNDK